MSGISPLDAKPLTSGISSLVARLLTSEFQAQANPLTSGVAGGCKPARLGFRLGGQVAHIWNVTGGCKAAHVRDFVFGG